MHWLVKALEHTADLSAKGAPSLQIMSAFATRADSSCLDIIELKYHQLKLVSNPASAMLEAYGKEDDELPTPASTRMRVHTMRTRSRVPMSPREIKGLWARHPFNPYQCLWTLPDPVVPQR